MAVADLAITLAAILEWDAPGGAVRLADDGVVSFNPGAGVALFEGAHPVFGSIAAFDTFETAIGDAVEGGSISFAPDPAATLSGWWRTDLENSGLKVWLGEINPADGKTLTDAELVADWLVDTAQREQGEASDILNVKFMTRQEKFFEIRQGNVCSDAFHDSIWAGEQGFENCIDAQQFFAWGTESPPAARGGGGFGGGGGGGGGGVDVGLPRLDAR